MIYVIAEVGDPCGPVKIGYTRGEPFEGGWEHGLKHRLRDIQMGNSRELEVIGLTPGTHKQELALHAVFGQYRAMNEWFHRVGPVLEFVCSVSVEAIRGSELRLGVVKSQQDVTSKAVRLAIARGWSRMCSESKRKANLPGRGRARTTCSACGVQGHNRATCAAVSKSA